MRKQGEEDNDSDDDVGENAELRLLLVDTNCFLRIYHSDLRPFLGADVGGYRIRTLISLLREVEDSNRLAHEYAWVRDDLMDEARNGTLNPLARADQEEIAEEIKALRRYANWLLDKHCTAHGMVARTLSGRDLELLATAAQFGAVIASDEWALGFVVADLISDEEANYAIEIVTSMEVLSILERAGKLSADARRATVVSWLRTEEKLPRDWQERYRALFDEAPPQIQ